MFTNFIIEKNYKLIIALGLWLIPALPSFVIFSDMCHIFLNKDDYKVCDFIVDKPYYYSSTGTTYLDWGIEGTIGKSRERFSIAYNIPELNSLEKIVGHYKKGDTIKVYFNENCFIEEIRVLQSKFNIKEIKIKIFIYFLMFYLPPILILSIIIYRGWKK